jgi:hypothetical protein
MHREQKRYKEITINSETSRTKIADEKRPTTTHCENAAGTLETGLCR